VVQEMKTNYKLDYKRSKPNRFAVTEQQIVVQIDEDVAKVFDSSAKVNSALRAIISAYPQKSKKTSSHN